MDIKEFLKNKKSVVYIALIFAVGIFMLTGVGKTTETTSKKGAEQEELSHRLENILSRVEGAGNVKVLINYSQSGEKILAYDSEEENRVEEGRDETNVRNQVVYDSSRSPFVLKEYMPTPQGVIIVAQGGDNESVKKQLIDGTVALLGIDEHKIEVLKMK